MCPKCGARVLGGGCDICDLENMRKTMVLNRSSGGAAQEAPGFSGIITRGTKKHIVFSKPRGTYKKKEKKK